MGSKYESGGAIEAMYLLAAKLYGTNHEVAEAAETVAREMEMLDSLNGLEDL